MGLLGRDACSKQIFQFLLIPLPLIQLLLLCVDADGLHFVRHVATTMTAMPVMASQFSMHSPFNQDIYVCVCVCGSLCKLITHQTIRALHQPLKKFSNIKKKKKKTSIFSSLTNLYSNKHASTSIFISLHHIYIFLYLQINKQISLIYFLFFHLSQPFPSNPTIYKTSFCNPVESPSTKPPRTPAFE